MALPLLPTTFRVALNHLATASPTFTNVIHVQSATLTPAQVLAALDGAAVPGMFDCVPTSIGTHTAVVTKLDNATPSFEGALANAGWDGAGGAESSPASSAVVTFKTSQRGKRHTGRIFIGYVAEDKMANGSLDPTSQATMQGAWTAFVANAATAGVPLVVASYGHDGAPPPPRPTRPAFAASAVTVNTASVSSTLGTQRRRQSRLRV
jgi:hypothetical protein